MSNLHFLPWCPIEEPIVAGDVRLIPYNSHDAIEGLDSFDTLKVRTIMSRHRTIQGRPIWKAALVKYLDKDLLENLTPDERENSREVIQLICFSALARREFFDSFGYCNSDCFIAMIQTFDEIPTGTTIVSRRREGRNMGYWDLDEVVFSVPLHCHNVKKINVDEALLDALVDYRKKEEDSWGRWQNSISCFNQANTDSDTVQFQVEWVLLASAFEHLLGTKTDNIGFTRRGICRLALRVTLRFAPGS